jgi:exopolyphosphatase/guanosine-5'-triphosphate,3'-diphosphate pyrophosphatase
LFLAGQRLAVIDVGSNGIRLLAVELVDDRSWAVLAEERATARLAEGQGKGGDREHLCPESMARAVEVIQRFKARCDALGCVVRAFATAAVRDARNRSDFLSLVQDRTGLEVEVISAFDEGRLTWGAVARRYDLSHGQCAVADIGGGSLEVVLGRDGVIVENASMPLGAVRLTEAFGGPDRCGNEHFCAMRRHIDRALATHVARPDTAPHMLVGCGGTFTTMLTLGAAMRGVMIERGSPALRTLGPLTGPQVSEMVERLRVMPLAERLRVPGLPADRADIAVAGLLVVERLMRRLGVSQVHANPGGVREGLLARMVRARVAERGEEASRDERLLASARALAAACRYERDHSEQVARLATRLYDQCIARGVISWLGSDAHERALLESAGVLHDVGIMVEYRRHHKHSAAIVRNADLPGWDARLQELLALLCRYHRRRGPGESHRAFAALAERDRALVRRLAGLLRVADGLDRSHAGVVEDARVVASRGRLRIEALSTGDATTEVRAALSKGDVLERVLGRGVDVEQVGVGEIVVKRGTMGALGSHMNGAQTDPA